MRAERDFQPASVFNGSRTSRPRPIPPNHNPSRAVPTGMPTPTANAATKPTPVLTKTQPSPSVAFCSSSPSPSEKSRLVVSAGGGSCRSYQSALRGGRMENSNTGNANRRYPPTSNSRPPFNRTLPPPRSATELRSAAVTKANHLLSDTFGDPKTTPTAGSSTARFHTIRRHLSEPTDPTAEPLNLRPWDAADLALTSTNSDGSAGTFPAIDIFDPAVLGPTIHAQAQQQGRLVNIGYFPLTAHNYAEAFAKKTLTWTTWAASAVATTQLEDVQSTYIAKSAPPLTTPYNIAAFVSGSALSLLRPFLASTLIRRPTEDNQPTVLAFRLERNPPPKPTVIDTAEHDPPAVDLIANLQRLVYDIAATAPTLYHLRQIADVVVTPIEDADTVTTFLLVTFPSQTSA